MIKYTPLKNIGWKVLTSVCICETTIQIIWIKIKIYDLLVVRTKINQLWNCNVWELNHSRLFINQI